MADNFNETWMTYDEAAAALGIKRASVQRRAALRKWPKRKGNNGKVQVGIPSDIIPDATPALPPAIIPAIIPDRLPADIAKIAGLEVEVVQLNLRLDDAQADNARLVNMMTEMTKPRSLWARIWGSRSN